MPTAEEAAAANLAWRAVNAPSTVTASEQAQAQQYSNQYWNVERPAQEARDAAIQQTIYQNRLAINAQEGLSYGGTHTEAQLRALSGSASVGQQSYEEERSYYESNPSSEYSRIVGQYNASRNAIASSNDKYYPATGWMSLNTTAGAGEYTGRAAQYKAAFEREVYGIGAPNNEQEYYRRQAEQAAVERPGYVAPADLGDIRTQQIRQGYGMFAQAVGLAGGDIASDYQMTGRLLETQRQAAYTTPERRDERFFMGELQKWAEIPVEKSSAYHDIGMESGKAIPANPYEYQADLAVEFLKGSPDKASEFFSPVSGEMSRHLPGGQGVQEYAWDEAITDYKRQNVDARTPYPERVSFMEGVTYLGAAEGKYGPYGKLAGGIDNGGVDLSGSSGITSRSKVMAGSSQLGITGETGPTVNFQDYYAKQQSEYASMLSAYEAGGSSDKSTYTNLLSRRDELILLGKANVGLEQSRYQANLLFTPITEADVVKTESKTSRQTGALPFVGEVQYVSPFLASFQPELTTTTKQYEAKGVFGGTISASSVETSEGKVPFAGMVSGVLPELHERRSVGGDLISKENQGGYLIDIITSPVREFTKTPAGSAIVMGAIGPKNYFTLTNPNLGKETWEAAKGQVMFAQGAIPMSPEWSKDTYENIRQDPMRGAVSAGLTIALVGIGTGARMTGVGAVGSRFLTPISTSGAVYQTASKVISAGMIGVYANDVSTRVTGSSLSQWVPIGQTKEQMGGGYFEGIQKRFPGWMESRKQLNVVETQELLPMAVAYKATSFVGDKLVGWARTRGVPENVNPKASGYMREEGFPKNDYITTKDLVDSFNTGTITLKSPAKLAETTMAPGGEPISRIPTGSQIGVPAGKTFIYHGGEVPVTLMRGYVGGQSSEIPALFASPQRLGHFTKAGTTGEGYGVTSDILGLYKQPWAARIVVQSGVYQEIPSEILNAKYPHTEMTVNNPLHPKNVAIADWIHGKTTTVNSGPQGASKGIKVLEFGQGEQLPQNIQNSLPSNMQFGFLKTSLEPRVVLTEGGNPVAMASYTKSPSGDSINIGEMVSFRKGAGRETIFAINKIAARNGITTITAKPVTGTEGFYTKTGFSAGKINGIYSRQITYSNVRSIPPVKHGVPIISQYGKAEWQFEIPSGSEIGSYKMTSFYRDVGTRIPEYDVTFSGKKSPKYKPAEPVIDPTTGKPVYEIGRASMGFSSSSISPSYRRSVPLGAISMLPKSSTTTSRTSPFSSGYSISYPKITSPSGISRQSYSTTPKYESPYSASSRESSPISSITSLKSTISGMSYSPSSFISSPMSTSKPPSSITTPKSTPTYTPKYTPTPPYTPPPYTPTPTPPYTPPPDTPFTGGGQLPLGGGGTGQKGWLGVTRWQRNNLVATSEYLSRGMRDIGMGWGAGTGTYSESTKWFSTGKKKSKRRRKK